MITGTVSQGGDASIVLRLRGPTGIVADVPAVLDTGFTENISLPTATIEQLGLELREEEQFVLADGTLVQVRVFRVQVDWFGNLRTVGAAEVEGVPLIGLGLLRGCRLMIEVIEGGRVEVSQLG